MEHKIQDTIQCCVPRWTSGDTDSDDDESYWNKLKLKRLVDMNTNNSSESVKPDSVFDGTKTNKKSETTDSINLASKIPYRQRSRRKISVKQMLSNCKSRIKKKWTPELQEFLDHDCITIRESTLHLSLWMVTSYCKVFSVSMTWIGKDGE